MPGDDCQPAHGYTREPVFLLDIIGRRGKGKGIGVCTGDGRRRHIRDRELDFGERRNLIKAIFIFGGIQRIGHGNLTVFQAKAIGRGDRHIDAAGRKVRRRQTDFADFLGSINDINRLVPDGIDSVYATSFDAFSVRVSLPGAFNSVAKALNENRETSMAMVTR